MGFFFLSCCFFSRKQIFPISLEMLSTWSVPTVTLRYKTFSKDCSSQTEESTVSSWKLRQTQKRKVWPWSLLRVSLGQQIGGDKCKDPLPTPFVTAAQVVRGWPRVSGQNPGTCCLVGFLTFTSGTLNGMMMDFMLIGHCWTVKMNVALVLEKRMD